MITVIVGTYHASMVRALSEDIGMTYAEIAKLLGTTVATLRRWRTNQETMPGPIKLLFRLLTYKQVQEYVKGNIETLNGLGEKSLLESLTVEERNLLSYRAKENLRTIEHEALFLIRKALVDSVESDIVSKSKTVSNLIEKRSEPIGIIPYNGRWKSNVNVSGKVVSLGIFDTIGEAVKSYEDHKDEEAKRVELLDVDIIASKRLQEERTLEVIDVVGSESTFNEGWED